MSFLNRRDVGQFVSVTSYKVTVVGFHLESPLQTPGNISALHHGDVTSWILKTFLFAAQIRLIQSLLLLPRPRLPLVFRTEPFVAMVSDSSSSEGVLRCFLPNAPATLLLAGSSAYASRARSSFWADDFSPCFCECCSPIEFSSLFQIARLSSRFLALRIS